MRNDKIENTKKKGLEKKNNKQKKIFILLDSMSKSAIPNSVDLINKPFVQQIMFLV